jgi:hypothetical protein
MHPSISGMTPPCGVPMDSALSELHVIAERYAKWEITGPPEIRSGTPVVMFSPWASLSPRPAAHLPPVEDPPPDHGPTPDPPPVEQPPPIEDQLERFLVPLFLRRYVTYCARRRRFAEMEGAARLHAKIAAAGKVNNLHKLDAISLVLRCLSA